MKFTVDFNKREHCTKEQYDKLESLSGVELDRSEYCYCVEIKDFNEMRVFEEEIDIVFDNEFSMIVSLELNTGYIFLTEE